MRRVFFFAIFLFAIHFSDAQSFGGNPSSIHWQQINTDTVRIIFPKGVDAKAQRIAAIVHSLQKKYAHSIGDTIRKVNIVLQSQTLLSNAYVGLAPYRSEFYLTPPQDAFELGAINWTDNLAVHEFRHVQQFSNFNKGLSNVASWLFGEQGRAVANAAAIPDWFFEGDAVFNETKLTKQGRGTLPLFLSSYRSLFNAGKTYSYEKMRNGSLRNYVPDHYALGYLLVAYGRKKYGDDIWRKITDDAVRFKPLFYPFQGALKKYTGISYDQFVNDALSYYQQQWKQTADEKMDWLTSVVKNDVVHYKYPYTTAGGSWIVVKRSARAIPAFYKMHANGSEEKLSVKAISDDDYFSYNKGKIVYAAYEPDARWSNREFHSIQLLNTETGEEKKVVSRTKYFSPDISHDGKLIVAAANETDTGRLVLLNSEDGQIIREIKQPQTVVSYPKFSKLDENIYWTSRNDAGEMSLNKVNTNGGQTETLLPSSNRIIGFLQVQGDTLLFTTTYNGRDEIWAIIDGKERKGPYRLATYSTGIYQASLQPDGRLIGSAFTAEGFRLASFEPKWERVEIKDELIDLYIDDAFQKADHSALDQLSSQQYPVSKYPKSFHLLNLHSFRPYYEQPEYSLTLYGQNILNTFQSEIAYTYNQNEGSSKIGYNGVFGGSFLEPVFGISQNWNRSGALNKDTTVNWNELVGYAGLQLPLNLTGVKSYRYLTLSSTFNTERVSWTGLAQKLLTDRNINYLNSRIAYSSQIQKSVQQIYPHLGQTLVLQYKSIVNKYTANQFLASGSFYLPGLANNHSLVLTAAFQSRDTVLQYLFSNNFPFARGYQAVDFPSMWRIGANYHFPLAFPDWGFGNIVYFLRIRSNLFFDYTQGKSLRTGLTYPFKTVGTELFFDTRWWNQQPVTFGIRYSRLIDNEFRGTTQPNVWELILPVNLFN
jgi:hypothetical protein